MVTNSKTTLLIYATLVLSLGQSVVAFDSTALTNGITDMPSTITDHVRNNRYRYGTTAAFYALCSIANHISAVAAERAVTAQFEQCWTEALEWVENYS